MANQLTLVQTSPPSNPDRMFLKCAVTGNYTNGTPDPLPLGAIKDPTGIGVIPNAASENNPPVVTPGIFNSWTPGYTPIVERTVANGETTFGLRWYETIANPPVELPTGAFPAAITGGEIFIEVPVNLATQS